MAAETLGCASTPAKRAPQLLGIRPDGVPAAFAVRKRDHAIDVGGQGFAFEAARDQFGGVRGAVAGRHHRDIVARAHAAVLARIAHEGGRVRRVPAECPSAGKFVIEVQLFKRQVVRVYMAARLDGGRGAADGLAVAPHGLTALNAGNAILWPAGIWSRAVSGLAVHLQLGPRGNGHARHGDVVGGMQVDDGVLRRRQLGNFEQHFIPIIYLMRTVSVISSSRCTWSLSPCG